MKIFVTFLLLVSMLQAQCSNADGSRKERVYYTSSTSKDNNDDSEEVLVSSSFDKNDMDHNIMGDLNKLTGDFVGSLKNVPHDLMNEALLNAVPKLRMTMMSYANAMHATSKKNDQHNPLLVGMSLGLRRWAESLSQLMPLLYKSASQPHYYKETDFDYLVQSEIWNRCFTESGMMCIDEEAITYSHPDICCPRFFGYL